MIFSEPARWEEYERYEEVAEILKLKYGHRIKDLLPTLESEYYLCGDDGKSYDFVDRVRLRLFVGENTLIDWAGFTRRAAHRGKEIFSRSNSGF